MVYILIDYYYYLLIYFYCYVLIIIYLFIYFVLVLFLLLLFIYLFIYLFIFFFCPVVGATKILPPLSLQLVNGNKRYRVRCMGNYSSVNSRMKFQTRRRRGGESKCLHKP